MIRTLYESNKEGVSVMGEVIEVDPVTGRVIEGREDRWVRTAVRTAVWFAVVGVAGYVTAWVCGPLAITSAPAGLVVAVAAGAWGLLALALVALGKAALLLAPFALGVGVVAWRTPAHRPAGRRLFVVVGVLVAVWAASCTVAPLAAVLADRIGG